MSNSPLSPIALIPLDDRPCNTRFPLEIVRIAGGEILLPPRELLGGFTRPARSKDVALKELRCDISLPWGRTFEVDVDVRFDA